MEQTFELRQLTAKDIFPMLRIIGKIGVNEFRACFESENVRNLLEEGMNDSEEQKKDFLERIGISAALEAINVLCCNLPKCERELLGFLASISGMQEKQVQELPMSVFMDMLVALVKKPEFPDFFTAVSRLWKPET